MKQKVNIQELRKIVLEEARKIIRERSFDEDDPFADPWRDALDMAARSSEGTSWGISEEWAQEIKEEFGLEMESGIVGEESALFPYKGVTLRLQKEFPNRWAVYNGAWKPDPRWTGD